MVLYVSFQVFWYSVMKWKMTMRGGICEEIESFVGAESTLMVFSGTLSSSDFATLLPSPEPCALVEAIF
jgi:hypothetical protein